MTSTAVDGCCFAACRALLLRVIFTRQLWYKMQDIKLLRESVGDGWTWLQMTSWKSRFTVMKMHPKASVGRETLARRGPLAGLVVAPHFTCHRPPLCSKHSAPLAALMLPAFLSACSLAEPWRCVRPGPRPLRDGGRERPVWVEEALSPSHCHAFCLLFQFPSCPDCFCRFSVNLQHFRLF